MQLNELFNPAKPDHSKIKITVDTPRTFEAKGEVNGKKIVIYNELEDHELQMWSINFTVDGSTEKTGGGNEMQIFALVHQALDMFIKLRAPKIVNMLAADGPNRAQLYARILKRANYFKRVVTLIDTEGEQPNIVAASVNPVFPIDIIADDMLGFVNIANSVSLAFDDTGEPTEDAMMYNNIETILQPEIALITDRLEYKEDDEDFDEE